MKVQELRIGNWINEGEGTAPYQVTADDIFWLSLPQNESKIQPITITPEILEKAGFVMSVFPEITEAFHDAFTLVLEEKGWDCLRILGKSVFINHVHQLQNLYWALVGEELKIEL